MAISLRRVAVMGKVGSKVKVMLMVMVSVVSSGNDSVCDVFVGSV